MILPFRGQFHRFSHQQSNSLHKFKDFKTFEFYGIQIETFEFTSETPKPKFELHDEKYVQGTQKFVRFRSSFKLQEFKLHDLNCI